MDEEQRAAVPPRRPSERDALSRRIQRALEEEARLWGQEQFYSPSPGQLWSHVANRITRVVVDELEHGE